MGGYGQGRCGPDPVRAWQRTVAVGAELGTAATLFGEMAVAAQTTIAFRTARLGEALFDPASLADPEFERMGWEKVEAAAASAAALTKGWGTVQDGLLRWGTAQALANQRIGLALLGARSPQEMASLQNSYSDATLGAAEQAAGRFVRAASRLARLGLRPYHTATRANAQRLGREALLP